MLPLQYGTASPSTNSAFEKVYIEKNHLNQESLNAKEGYINQNATVAALATKGMVLFRYSRAIRGSNSYILFGEIGKAFVLVAFSPGHKMIDC